MSSDDEDGAIRGVVREDAEFVHHVVPPDDVRVLGAEFDLRFAGPDDSIAPRL